MSRPTTPTREFFSNFEGFLKKFKLTTESQKDQEILTLANLDSGRIRKFIVKKVDERSLFRRSSQKSLKDENENKSKKFSSRSSSIKRKKQQAQSTSKQNDGKRKLSSSSLQSLKSACSLKRFGSKQSLDSHTSSGKKKRRSSLGSAKFKLGWGGSSSSESETDDIFEFDEGEMIAKDRDDEKKDDPGFANEALVKEDFEDEDVELNKEDIDVLKKDNKEDMNSQEKNINGGLTLKKQGGEHFTDTGSVSSLDSSSPPSSPRFKLKMSPVPKRSRKKRSDDRSHSPVSFRSGYQSNRSSISSVRKGILKKTNSCTTINMEMANLSRPQTPTDNGLDPFDETYSNGDSSRFCRNADNPHLNHQRSFNRVKFILDSGRPDNVTGDYDDIKIENKNDKLDRDKARPVDKTNQKGLSRGGRKCVVFSAGLLIMTMAVILGSFFGSRKSGAPPKALANSAGLKYIVNAVEGKFRIVNQPFYPDLYSHESADFRMMSKALEDVMVKAIFVEETANEANSTIKLRIVKYEEGSVISVFRIKWEKTPRLELKEIKKRIHRHLNKYGAFGDYQVEKSSFSISELQDWCDGNKQSCSHFCIFSDDTLRFDCTCPDNLILINSTTCMSSDHTTSTTTTTKNPVFIPGVINEVLKSNATLLAVKGEKISQDPPPSKNQTFTKQDTKGEEQSKDKAKASLERPPSDFKNTTPEKEAVVITEPKEQITTAPTKDPGPKETQASTDLQTSPGTEGESSTKEEIPAKEEKDGKEKKLMEEKQKEILDKEKSKEQPISGEEKQAEQKTPTENDQLPEEKKQVEAKSKEQHVEENKTEKEKEPAEEKKIQENPKEDQQTVEENLEDKKKPAETVQPVEDTVDAKMNTTEGSDMKENEVSEDEQTTKSDDDVTSITNAVESKPADEENVLEIKTTEAVMDAPKLDEAVTVVNNDTKDQNDIYTTVDEGPLPQNETVVEVVATAFPTSETQRTEGEVNLDDNKVHPSVDYKFRTYSEDSTEPGIEIVPLEPRVEIVPLEPSREPVYVQTNLIKKAQEMSNKSAVSSKIEAGLSSENLDSAKTESFLNTTSLEATKETYLELNEKEEMLNNETSTDSMLQSAKNDVDEETDHKNISEIKPEITHNAANETYPVEVTDSNVIKDLQHKDPLATISSVPDIFLAVDPDINEVSHEEPAEVSTSVSSSPMAAVEKDTSTNDNSTFLIPLTTVTDYVLGSLQNNTVMDEPVGETLPEVFNTTAELDTETEKNDAYLELLANETTSGDILKHNTSNATENHVPSATSLPLSPPSLPPPPPPPTPTVSSTLTTVSPSTTSSAATTSSTTLTSPAPTTSATQTSAASTISSVSETTEHIPKVVQPLQTTKAVIREELQPRKTQTYSGKISTVQGIPIQIITEPITTSPKPSVSSLASQHVVQGSTLVAQVATQNPNYNPQIDLKLISDVSHDLSIPGAQSSPDNKAGQGSSLAGSINATEEYTSSPSTPTPVPSSSSTTTTSPCTMDEFQCSDRVCIPKEVRCDSVFDCSDRSDEAQCIENKCLDNYQCRWSGDCLARKFVCDGVKHCTDGDDEEGCETWKCNEDEFRCSPGSMSTCIPLSQKCDGYADCFNRTDEFNCTSECPKDEFFCPEGSCIPNLLKCDGRTDCLNGEDEEECGCEGLDQSPCAVGGCVPTFKICDGLRQCPDGSDEWGCLKIDNDTKQLQVRSSDGRWSAVCGDKWTAQWTDLVCEQLGFGFSLSTEVRRVSESVLRPRVKLSPDATKVFRREMAPLQYFLAHSDCSNDPLVHVSCKMPECGNWNISTPELQLHSQKNEVEPWPSLGLLIKPEEDSATSDNHACAASIITPTWVLTSYSCLASKTNGFEAQKWALLIGEFSPKAGEGETQLRYARQIVVYPGAKRVGMLWVGDAALLRLQTPLTFGPSVQPICLAEEPAASHDYCVVASWKPFRTEVVESMENRRKQALQNLPIPNLTLNTCNTSYYNGQLSKKHTCASFLQDKNSPCTGNESAPLMCRKKNGPWQLHGLLSRTGHCASFNLPSVFTDVSSIHSWLFSTIGRPTPGEAAKHTSTTTTTTTSTTTATTTTTSISSTTTPSITKSTSPNGEAAASADGSSSTARIDASLYPSDSEVSQATSTVRVIASVSDAS